VNSKTEFIICGDLNVGFSEDSNSRLQVSCLLQPYNLFHAVDFSTRFNNTSCSIIDSIFIDKSRVNLFKVLPIMVSQIIMFI
jgi:hypothetical protein